MEIFKDKTFNYYYYLKRKRNMIYFILITKPLNVSIVDIDIDI